MWKWRKKEEAGTGREGVGNWKTRGLGTGRETNAKGLVFEEINILTREIMLVVSFKIYFKTQRLMLGRGLRGLCLLLLSNKKGLKTGE